jgi:hypothetical protein
MSDPVALTFSFDDAILTAVWQHLVSHHHQASPPLLSAETTIGPSATPGNFSPSPLPIAS